MRNFSKDQCMTWVHLRDFFWLLVYDLNYRRSSVGVVQTHTDHSGRSNPLRLVPAETCEQGSNTHLCPQVRRPSFPSFSPFIILFPSLFFPFLSSSWLLSSFFIFYSFSLTLLPFIFSSFLSLFYQQIQLNPEHYVNKVT